MDPHVDDGRLNALLDGELDAAERGAVETHLAGCAECRARYEEARRFLAGAADLLGYLDAPSVAAAPPAARAPAPQVAPPARPAVTASEAAIVLPGPGVAKTAQEPAVNPSRVARTAKEKAVDVGQAPPVPPTVEAPALPDLPAGATPAVRPIFPQAQRGEPGEEPPRVWGMPPLAWAAMLVVGLGAAILAQRALTPDRPAMDVAAGPPLPAESAAGTGAPTEPAAAEPARVSRPAARTPLVKPRTMRGDKPPTAEEAAARIPLDRPAGARRTDELSARSADAAGPPANAAAGAGGRTQPVTGALGAAAAPRPAPAAPAPAPTTAARAARQPAGEARAAEEAPAAALAFQRIDFDEAVRRLSGSIRLIDGMQPERVEVGPGQLVPGAAPDREVVRVYYADDAGRPLVLDQQPGDTPAATSVNGLMRGDTLVTSQPDGSIRVRWVDRKSFWLSLTGAGGPDTVRMLVERIR